MRKYAAVIIPFFKGKKWWVSFPHCKKQILLETELQLSINLEKLNIVMMETYKIRSRHRW